MAYRRHFVRIAVTMRPVCGKTNGLTDLEGMPATIDQDIQRPLQDCHVFDHATCVSFGLSDIARQQGEFEQFEAYGGIKGEKRRNQHFVACRLGTNTLCVAKQWQLDFRSWCRNEA